VLRASGCSASRARKRVVRGHLSAVRPLRACMQACASCVCASACACVLCAPVVSQNNEETRE